MTAVTIIIPTFNMGRTVWDAVRSVTQQDADWCLIVVDDGSQVPFSAPENLSGDSRISVIRHSTNRGASAARNTGLAAAETPWVGFLDADDTLEPNTLARRLNFAIQHLENGDCDPSRTFFASAWHETDRATGARIIRTPLGADTPIQFASGCWWSPGSVLLCHRSAFAGLEYDENLTRLEDFDLFLRAACNGVSLVVDPTVAANIQPSNRVNLSKIQSTATQIQQKHAELKSTNPPVWRAMNAYLQLELSTASFRANHFGAALYHAVRSLWFKPRLTRHFSPGWTRRIS